MAFTMFVTGFGFLEFFTAHFCREQGRYQIKHVDTYLICGLVCVTVYAQFFSLIYKVGLTANLLLCLFCAFIVWKYRHIFGARLASLKENNRKERGRMLGIFFLFFLFAYGTSRGIIHYDTGLYHAQSIRWLEEYGVVKGLGNLHCRLAYNSSSFALSALYSMAFLGGQSYHCAAGFLAFLLSKICLEIIDSFARRRLRIADFARVMGIYYLVIIFDEMISPASDYFMVLLAFYIIIRWLDLLEEEERAIMPYALLCVLGVFLMTVKLSAALVLLLVIYPAYYLVRKKRGKEIVLYLATGFFVALPYLIRNVLLSGWLVYPFTQIDLFPVKWKIPKGLADYDAKEIQVWGRGYTEVDRYDIGVGEWIFDWFKGLAGSDKLLVLSAFCSIVILCVYAIGMAFGLWRRRLDILLVQLTLAASFLFWLFSSPLIRYGCVYVYLTPAVILGGIYDALLHGGTSREVRQAAADKTADKRLVFREKAELFGLAAVLLLVGYKAVALGKEIVVSYTNDYWITQKDYDNFEVEAYKIENVTFYYPVTGDRVGYESFPSSPTKADIAFLGSEIAEGFYQK